MVLSYNEKKKRKISAVIRNKVEKMRYCTLSISTIIAHCMNPAFVKPIIFVPLSKRRQTWQDQDRVIDRLRETEIAKTRHQASQINYR
ncbi:hypothetical protein OUZ56_008410 [Daphnia magna]|uniref:Uncharacterized protein n=1 Tax=Daphnia magna TaxID=35525 RepID=A0ABR0ACV5_9CRUS|nr:hypothetical protein OUZ56_008410 [Daphnia magna]